MVPADSQRISRARCYSGACRGRARAFAYRTLTVYGRPSQASSASARLSHYRPTRQGRERQGPQPRKRNGCRLSRAPGLASSAFARHYLRNHMLFSLPAGTEMFHFPAFPPRTLCVQMRVTRQLAPLAGFPHSDTLGSQSGYRLPQAYRRFLRPSSAPNAKASTVCS